MNGVFYTKIDLESTNETIYIVEPEKVKETLDSIKKDFNDFIDLYHELKKVNSNILGVYKENGVETIYEYGNNVIKYIENNILNKNITGAYQNMLYEVKTERNKTLLNKVNELQNKYDYNVKKIKDAAGYSGQEDTKKQNEKLIRDIAKLRQLYV